MALRKRRPGMVYPTWEDWHYVGDTDEPAFQNSWANSEATKNLAFRTRETGVVDIEGDVYGGTSVVFTLPASYRPSAKAFCAVTGLYSTELVAAILRINTTGDVTFGFRSTNPPTRFYVSAQFFLNPSDAP